MMFKVLLIAFRFVGAGNDAGQFNYRVLYIVAIHPIYFTGY
jgi:hypothetical protein